MISRKLRKLAEKRYLFPRARETQTSFWVAENASFPIVISHGKGRGVVAWLSRFKGPFKVVRAQTRNMQTYIIL